LAHLFDKPATLFQAAGPQAIQAWLSWVVLGCLATNLNQQISCRISLNLSVLSLASFVSKEICKSHELSIDVELDVTHIPISLQKGDVCFHHPNAVHLSQILAKKIEQDRTR
jgi:hypothetical protein